MSENVDDSIDIKIKMLHNGTFTIPAAKQLFILGLKEQIAIVSGVISDLHHLLFRGRVLKDNKRLSDYHVEDGDTLYLVPRRSQTGNNNNSADGLIIKRLRFTPSLNVLAQPDPNSHFDLEVPDALTFLNDCLKDCLIRSNEQDSGLTRENQIPIASSMAWIIDRMEKLLTSEIAKCLRDMVREVANCLNHANPPEELLVNLGNSLTELCHASSSMAMGERPICTSLCHHGNHLQPSQSQPQTDIRRLLIVLRASPSNQQQVITESQNAVSNTSSPQPTRDEEVRSDPDPEDEMVKTVTSLVIYIRKERWMAFEKAVFGF